MSGTTNSISYQLEQALTLQENGVRLMNAYRDALLSNKTHVTVELLAIDGSTFNLDIPTNVNLGTRLNNLAATVENLVGVTKDGKSRLITTSTSTISELIVKTKNLTDIQQLQADEIGISQEIAINNNAILENLLSPLPTLELSIPNELDTTSYLVEKYIFPEASGMQPGIYRKELLKILSAQKLQYKYVKSLVDLNPREQRYSGNFGVLESSIDGNNIKVRLTTVMYDDKDNIAYNTKVIQVDDIISKADQAIKYKVLRVDQPNNTLLLEQLSGIGGIVPGDELIYVDTISENNITISIPVKLNESSVIFITPINNLTNTSGLVSDGIVFDSKNYFVMSNYNEIPFNEYFSTRISDISSYFASVLSENVIPINLAIKPDIPVIEERNFKILQINKHLTNSTVTDRLEKLQKEKSITENQIDVIQNTITNLNTKINSGNYASNAKRESDKSLLSSKIQERDEKSTLLSSIVKNISSTVSTSQKEVFQPKYKLRGFWKLGNDLISDQTRDQKIIQYEIRYRYTTLKSNISTSEQFVYKDGNADVTAVISPWNYVLGSQLTRLVKEDKTVEWVANDENSIDEININQLDISITYGEAVEFQIRAISEAGWPTTSIKSDWSKLVRKEFGDDIVKQNTILGIIDENQQDLLKVQVENEFRNQGYTRHIANSYTEQEKYFPHKLEDIASGKMTGEQKTISALEYVQSLEKEISALKEIVDKRYAPIAVQLVDSESLITYDVNNFSTIKLFAGNYTDKVDLGTATNFGAIVTKKFYLKLINQNVQTIEMLSIAPGGLSQTVMSEKYTKVPIQIQSEGFTQQHKGQIFYNRMNNVDLTTPLYTEDAKSTFTIPSGDIDTAAGISERNVVHKTSAGSIETIKLLQSASMDSYVAMTVDHPAYIDYKSSGSVTEINKVFERIENFNKLFREPTMQSLFDDDNLYGYDQLDRFLVGQNTVGAALYVSLNDFASYQVQGVDSSSAKEIYSGDQDSIIIPIIFQYRMTDALGNVNGLNSLNANSNFEYSKIIGFDLFVNNKIFAFDVEVYAQYRPSTTANQRLNIVQSSNNIRAKLN